MMTEKSILMTGALVSEQELQPLLDAGFRVDARPAYLTDDELIDIIGDYEGYLFGGDEFLNASILEHGHKLEAISLIGTDIDFFLDRDAAVKNNIALANTPGVLADSVSEFLIGQWILVNRTPYLARMKSVDESTGADSPGNQVTRSRVGIVGLGEIGSRVSNILTQGFHCDVKYFSRTRKPDIEKRDGIIFCELSELVNCVDSLIVCVPNTDESKGMFSKELIESITSPIAIISVSSSGVYDSAALLTGLREEKISRLALDHFNFPENKEAQLLLDDEQRVFVTRHMGSMTSTAHHAMAEMAVGNLLKALS